MFFFAPAEILSFGVAQNLSLRLASPVMHFHSVLRGGGELIQKAKKKPPLVAPMPARPSAHSPFFLTPYL